MHFHRTLNKVKWVAIVCPMHAVTTIISAVFMVVLEPGTGMPCCARTCPMSDTLVRALPRNQMCLVPNFLRLAAAWRSGHYMGIWLRIIRP